MAILWADGFDDFTNTSGFAGEYEQYNSGNMTIATTSGRRGGGALSLASNTDWLGKLLPAPSTEIISSVAFRSGHATQVGVMQFGNGQSGGSNVYVCTLRWNSDGSFSVVSGNLFGSVLGTTAAGLAPVGVWTHVQMRVVFATSGGVAQLRINGQTSLALNVTGNTGAQTTGVYLFAGNYPGLANLFDDWVLSDTSGSVASTWLGDVRVDSYRPSGNGDLSEMTGSDGNSADNYALVDGAAPNGTDYVQGDLGHEDLYQVADMTHTPAAIFGVVCAVSALKDDAGGRSIRMRVKSGAADATSPADIALATSRQRVGTVFSVDPNTGAAWTKAGFDAAQFGFEVTV